MGDKKNNTMGCIPIKPLLELLPTGKESCQRKTEPAEPAVEKEPEVKQEVSQEQPPLKEEVEVVEVEESKDEFGNFRHHRQKKRQIFFSASSLEKMANLLLNDTEMKRKVGISMSEYLSKRKECSEKL